MGTMLRNNDELHILTVINKDDEMGSTEDIQKQVSVLSQSSKLMHSPAHAVSNPRSLAFTLSAGQGCISVDEQG
jgi:hypothetical protein